MKRLLVLVATLLLGSNCFAESLSKLSTLGAAFKKHPTVQPRFDKNDIEIVYGGADVSKPELGFSHLTA